MEYSEETAREIDQEVRRFIDGQTARVKELLTKLNPVLLEAAHKLMTAEVMTGDDLRTFMEGGKKKQDYRRREGLLTKVIKNFFPSVSHQ